MNKTLLYLVFVSLCGCVTNRSLEISEPYLNWEPYCYEGFDKRVAELADGPYLNCGFFSSVKKPYGTDDFFHSLSNGLTCVDDAYINKQAFIFGTHSIWKDTYLCEAFVFSNKGELFRLFLDFDTAGGADTSGERSWYIEEVCEGLEITEKITVSHYLNHVAATGCVPYVEK